MVVKVTVDRQRAPIAEGLQKPLNLPTQLEPKLRSQASGADTSESLRPEADEPSMKSSATVDEEIHFPGGRQGTAFEKVQVKGDSELRTIGQGIDGVFPASTVDYHTCPPERPGVVAGHNGVGDPCG
jgi:hypothetical protein